MNPNLQEILHNITSRLASLEQNAESDKLLVNLIQEQRAEIGRLRKEWVALTDDDYPSIRDGDHAFHAGWTAAEAKLRSKNESST
jgi:hypothetical protein